VAEFVDKIWKDILAKALARQKSQNSRTTKGPNNDLTLPVFIVILSLLVLTTLMLIIRRKRQRRF
jgi:hypothetical protein